MEYTFIGNHPSILKVRELINLISDTVLNVLLIGETGTGKDVLAHLLHETSPRISERFVQVNCAALPLTLLESELFGYEKGAFTGADKTKPGKFELASNGVIFLDEIGDMPLSLQTKLLHVLQNDEFTRLGGRKSIKMNAWIICSTNHDLEKDIKEGQFREDLYYRMNIIRVELPPLRERAEDIPVLIDYFFEKYRREFNIDGPERSPDHLKEFFQGYHWPGNVRELSSAVLQWVLGEDPDQIKSEMQYSMKSEGMENIPDQSKNTAVNDRDKTDDRIQSNNNKPLSEIVSQASKHIERRVITYALERSDWNKRKAARILKISYKSLFNKMAKLGIEK